MTNNTVKARQFIRNSLEGITNKTEDAFLSKLEDHINSMGQYIIQRQGISAFNGLLNHVCSDSEELKK